MAMVGSDSQASRGKVDSMRAYATPPLLIPKNCDRMECDVMGWDGMRCIEMGWDEMIWHRMP